MAYLAEFGNGRISDVLSNTQQSASLIRHVCRRCGHPELATHVVSQLETHDKILCKVVQRKLKADPLAPTRARSGYDLFCADERPKLRSELADTAKVDVIAEMKELASRWKSVEEDLKMKYGELARQDKERYAKELSQYKDATCASNSLKGPGTTIGGVQGVETKGAQSTLASKRIQERIAKHHAETAQRALDLLRDLITMTCEMCSCPERAPELCEEMLDAKMVRAAFRKPKRNRDEPRKPRNGWMLFSTSDKYPDMPKIARTKKMGEDWRSDPALRQHWHQEAEKDKVRYRDEKAAYDLELVRRMGLVATDPAEPEPIDPVKPIDAMPAQKSHTSDVEDGAEGAQALCVE